MVGLELAGLISVGTPRTKPTSSRPREMQSIIAISSAMRTGSPRLATGLPRIRMRAFLVCRARIAAGSGTQESMQLAEE